jgi:hypothetical protein
MTCAYRECGMVFEPRKAGQKYHSSTCREKARNERHPVVRLAAPKDAVRPGVTIAGRLTRKRSRGDPCLFLGNLPRGRRMAKDAGNGERVSMLAEIVCTPGGQ